MPGCTNNSNSTASKVELKKNESGYHRLYVNNQEFFVEGAGLEFGNIEALAEYGGNSFRTWCTRNEQEDANQIYVSGGIQIQKDHKLKGESE